jgi:hypothetical protein
MSTHRIGVKFVEGTLPALDEYRQFLAIVSTPDGENSAEIRWAYQHHGANGSSEGFAQEYQIDVLSGNGWARLIATDGTDAFYQSDETRRWWSRRNDFNFEGVAMGWDKGPPTLSWVEFSFDSELTTDQLILYYGEYGGGNVPISVFGTSLIVTGFDAPVWWKNKVLTVES